MRCLVYIFTVRINSKSFPLAVRSVQETETYLPKFSAASNVRYCILKLLIKYATVRVLPDDRYTEEKHTELETENKSIV